MDRQAKLQELFDKYQLGVNYHKQGELESAEAIYREVLQFIPNHPDVLHMLGLAIYEQGNPENAVELIDRSIRLNPQQPGFHKHLAVVYLEMQQYEQAITCVKNAIALKPDYAAAYNLLGNIYQAQKDLTQALSSYQKAGELEPNSAEFRHNLGSVYQKLEDFTSAIPHHLKAIELQPDFAIAHNFLANAYHRLGERQKALTHWQIAVELAPQAPEIRCNLGLALLLEGDFNRGWQEYEWRLKTQALKKFDLKTPMWQGQDLQGKSIYLWSEQGLGDTIQFARYAWELKRRGAQVTLGVNKGLISLFTDCVTEKFQVVDGLRSKVYEHDYHVSVMSLPRIFGTDLTNIPQQIPYVTVAKIKTAIEPTDNYKIGIVWASKKTASQYTRKTCTPELFMDFLALGKVSLYSLQVGEDRSLITPWLKEDNVSDLSGELFNFADTAQFIAQLDLIITVDTAVAHLAGAMGKPTWLLLSYMPDWRWLLNRQDTPWYPTMRLFRQSKLNDWASVFTQVKEQLIKVLAGSDPVFPVDNKSGGEVSHQEIANQLSVIEQKKLDKKDITELLAKGLTHYQKQELSLAESYYQQVLEIEPQHPEALHILGLIACQENKPGLAIALLQRAIQQNPSAVNYYQNLALVYEKTGNLPEAIAVYQQAINLQPHKGELFSGLADCYRQQAQIKEAIQAYTQAIKLQVTHLDLYLSLGKIYEQENQLEQALAVYRQALKYHPNSGCLHNLMGIIYQYQGKIEQASAASSAVVSQYGPR
ncbi:MAG: tetratricopeptide repeat protein, partial [Cyanobacteria bacterium J083]